MPLMLSEELLMEDLLSGFRGVTDGGCSFRFQRSYRWRMPLKVSEEERASSVCSSSET
jgi:hypothetical protein